VNTDCVAERQLLRLAIAIAAAALGADRDRLAHELEAGERDGRYARVLRELVRLDDAEPFVAAEEERTVAGTK
jgi:hypothetical protein